MEIEKEQNIVVRYIPQYIVIETRYKSVQSDAEQQLQFSKIPSNTIKYETGERLNWENSITTINFDPCNAIEYAEEDQDANNFEGLKRRESFDGKTSDTEDSKVRSPRRKYNCEASKLLDDWFLSHLHDPYPTEAEKDHLVSATGMTKLQVNYWFINKRKRNKHLLNNTSKTSKSVGLFEDIENALLDEFTSNVDGSFGPSCGTTVELEVVIQPDLSRKPRKKKKAVQTDQSGLPAICDICGKTFSHRYMLQSHLKRHDPSTWEVCQICHKSFPDGLKRHMRVHSGERPYVCNECGAAYKQAYGLTMHKAIHADSGELFFCDTCNNGRGYKSKYALKDHLKLHYRVRNDDSALVAMKSTWKPPKVCTLCGFETYNIRSHMIARHSTLRPFKCEICTETFKFKKDLQTHHAYHSDEMNFQCDHIDCHKRFKTKRKLVIHKRIHTTTEKSFKCTECEKSFLVSTYLRKHMRLHTGEKKRHACTECSKDYSGITDLRRHLEREHGIKIQPNPKYSNNNMTKKHKVT